MSERSIKAPLPKVLRSVFSFFRPHASNAELADELKAANQRLQLARTEAEKLYQQAQNANRIKDEFLMILSHELRTPLHSIVGWIDLLRNHPYDKQIFDQGFQVLARSAKAQAKLIDDLLDISKIMAGKVQLEWHPVDLAALVQSVLESLRVEIKAKNLGVELSIDTSQTLMSGDPTRIQQIIWNLIDNAVRFSHPGGSIAVTLSPKDSKIELTVQDEGEGIDPEFLPKLLEPFQQENSRTTRKHGGLGLGLAITRKLVELHGGTIEVSSPGKGRGATFRVTFPVEPLSLPGERAKPVFQKELVHEVPAPNPVSKDIFKGLRIFVVDDDIDSLNLLATYLRNYGAEVGTSLSAPDALKRLPLFHPDLLISDIGMPDMDGYELIQKLRELNLDWIKRLPAAALTAYAREEERRKALDAGFQAHVSKPVKMSDLMTLISSLTVHA